MSDAARAEDRGALQTERENPRTAELDRLDARAAVALVQAEDRRVFDAVAAAREEIARAVELVADRLAGGGRLLYVGAGTSGRLGLLDAVECPPTFHTEPERVQAVLAGGEGAFVRAVEGAEDDGAAARAELARREVGARDVVFGIAAGGTTPFVHAALDEARARGAATVFLACVPFEEAPDAADLSIRVVTGPEVLTGSTRLKAGTATKLVLNTVTTLAMARLGRVHGNHMVDLRVTNAKLRDRAERLVMRLCDVDRDEASRLLESADDRVKIAVLVHRGLAPEEAHRTLDAVEGSLRRALDSTTPRRD